MRYCAYNLYTYGDANNEDLAYVTLEIKRGDDKNTFISVGSYRKILNFFATKQEVLGKHEGIILIQSTDKKYPVRHLLVPESHPYFNYYVINNEPINDLPEYYQAKDVVKNGLIKIRDSILNNIK